MFRKVFIVSFFSLICLPAFAGELPKVISAELADSAQNVVKKMPAQIAYIANTEQLESKSNQPETKLSDAWLISLALLGFVMLSNRSAV